MEFVLQKQITDEMRQLIAASDRYMEALYPPESNHLVDLDSLIGDSFEYYLLWDEGACVGCVGIKLDDDHPELKRLFVDERYRGRAYGRKLLAFAIARCTELGLEKVRLETGISQPEATSLFERMGFHKIGPFGSYKPDPLSLFYERSCR